MPSVVSGKGGSWQPVYKIGHSSHLHVCLMLVLSKRRKSESVSPPLESGLVTCFGQQGCRGSIAT